MRIRQGDVVRHFKGGVYTVIALALDCENPSRSLTVYQSRQDAKIWVRPTSQFYDQVVWPDGLRRTRFIIEDDQG